MNLDTTKFLDETKDMDLSEVGAYIRSLCKADIAKAEKREPDGRWLEELKREALYDGIDIGLQFGLCAQWCKNNRKHLSKQRFVNWLANHVGKHNGHNRGTLTKDGSGGRNSGIGGRSAWEAQRDAHLAATANDESFLFEGTSPEGGGNG